MTTLSTQAATVPEPIVEAVPAPPPMALYADPRVARAKTLRTLGATLALVGPPALIGGGVWALVGMLGGSDSTPGIVLMSVGGLSTLASVPLLLGSSALSRSALRMSGGTPRASALPWIAVSAGALALATPFVSVGLMNYYGRYTNGFETIGISAGLFAVSVGSSWIWANQNLKAARDLDLSVDVLHLPPVRSDAQPVWGVRMSGRF